MKISAILFDIGGVLIELNGLPSIAKLLDSNQSLDDIYKYWMAAPSVIGHETGKLSTDEFAKEVVKDLKLTITPEAFMENFATWVVGTFPDTFALLDAIPDTIKVAALSNTSGAHWKEVEATGLTDKIEHLFLSHEIGHLKPSAPAFQAAVDGLGIPAAEIIFFDDVIENVNAASAFGLKAHQALNPAQAKQTLMQYGLI
ncbi:MAG: HAD-IA family hydrolase [Methylophilaceae bacterium]